MKTIATYQSPEWTETEKINLSQNRFYLSTYDEQHLYDDWFDTLSELVWYHKLSIKNIYTKKVCAWCDTNKVITDGFNSIWVMVSHGMCKKCVKKF